MCTTCYIKGLATGDFTFEDNSNANATQLIEQYAEDFTGGIENITSEAWAYLETYVKDEFDRLVAELEGHVTPANYALPSFPYNLTRDIAPMPEVNLHFNFDGMELYVLLDTTLSLGATYTLSLYMSKTEIGVGISEKLQLGIVFAVDLILTVDDTIDISSGFHIKFDDGLAIDIALFDDDISAVTL